MQRTCKIRALAEPFPNPHPDGRKRDWTGAKEFPAGRYTDNGSTIQRIGARYAYVLGETYQALAAAAPEVDPVGVHEILLTLGAEDFPEQIIGYLYRTGAITREQLAHAAYEVTCCDEAEFEKLTREDA